MDRCTAPAERTESNALQKSSQADDFMAHARGEERRLLERCRGTIRPCHTLLKMVENYVLGNYNTQEIPPDEVCLEIAAMNMAASIHRDAFTGWESPEETDAKLREFRRHDPAPMLRRYLIKEQGMGRMLYAAQKKEQEALEKAIYQWQAQNGRLAEPAVPRREPILVEFEFHTGSLRVENSSLLYHELIVYRGVEEKDIQEETPAYLQYLQSMQALGLIS